MSMLYELDLPEDLHDRWRKFHRHAPTWRNLDELICALLKLHFDESDAVLKSIQDQERGKKEK